MTRYRLSPQAGGDIKQIKSRNCCERGWPRGCCAAFCARLIAEQVAGDSAPQTGGLRGIARILKPLNPVLKLPKVQARKGFDQPPGGGVIHRTDKTARRFELRYGLGQITPAQGLRRLGDVAHGNLD